MSEEEKIQKFLRAYLTENNIKQDFAERIIKQAEHYDTKSKNQEFLSRFFDVLKKCYDGKNAKSFSTACKRFLFIINKLLGGDSKKEKPGKYCETISQQIVQYYLFIFEIILKNSLYELTIELKMYRMKWAKRITDAAFVKLGQEIFKKHNFNLDKGFSSQNIEKIKKIHKSRGLTQKQSNFYLGLQPKEETQRDSVNIKPGRSSSSDSDASQGQYGSPSPNKKVKKNQNLNKMYEMHQIQPSSYSHNSGYHPAPITESYSYQAMNNLHASGPRINEPMYNQNGYENYPENFNCKTYHSNEIYDRQQTSISQVNYSYVQPLNAQNISNVYYPAKIYAASSYEKQSNSQTNSKESSEIKNTGVSIEKIQKIRNFLQKNLYRCRQCGQMFQTKQTYKKHTTSHFFESLQKVNEGELKGKMKKQSKIRLFDIKSWEAVEQQGEKDYKFQVLLSELSQQKGERNFCFFCNQALEISFSPKYQDWVFSDAIKINDEGDVNIMHFNCYQCFKSDQNSPEQS